jgi:hypothetical protein
MLVKKGARLLHGVAVLDAVNRQLRHDLPCLRDERFIRCRTARGKTAAALFTALCPTYELAGDSGLCLTDGE